MLACFSFISHSRFQVNFRVLGFRVLDVFFLIDKVLIFCVILWVLEVVEKARVQIEVLKGLFGRLAEILKECPGQYYR